MATFEEDAHLFNGHMEVDVVIEAPPMKVWRQFIDLNSWLLTHDVEELTGERGKVGVITRVSPKKGSARMSLPPPHYHYCKLIKAIPGQQYVLKTYSEQGGSYGMQLTAFDDTRFIELDSATRVTFNFYGQYSGERIDPAQMSLNPNRDNMLKNLANLKRIVEESGAL